MGKATTKSAKIAGKQLWVNALVKSRGELAAELLTDDSKVISGFSKEDCKKVRGDHHNVQFTWTGGNRAPQNAAKIRFYLIRAYLYGYEWR